MQEYEGSYNKRYGIDQSRGVREEVARHMYADKFDQWLRDGILTRQYFDGHAYVAMTEKIAGTETGTQQGKQYKRGRASSAIEMDEAASVLKELNWFWNIPKNLSLKDGMTDQCVEKLGEAVDAHIKLFKSAVDIKKKLVDAGEFIVCCIPIHL